MRDCKNCKHLIMYDYKNKSYSCEKWECKFEPEEQEPTTKNDLGVDLISRNEILNRLASIAKVKAKSDAQKSLMGRCMFMVEHLPSVTPQRSSGLAKNSKKIEKDSGELDCISRKAILDELEKWDWQELYLPIHFKQMLDELPSVTPQEPRKGHWDIKDKMWWVCSACGCQTRMMKKYNVPNFCPACGADMREVEE